MATKIRKSRILVAAATLAIAMTGMSASSFAQRDDRGPGAGRPAPQMQRGDMMNQMRERREQFRQQRAQEPRQMPMGSAAPRAERPSWGGRGEAPQQRPSWSGGQPRQDQGQPVRQGWQQRGEDRQRNPMWRGGNPGAGAPAVQPDRRADDARREAAQRWRDNAGRPVDTARPGNERWRDNDRRGDNDRWRNDGRRWSNDGWRDNDRRGDNDRWRNDGRRWSNDGWRDNDRRGDNDRWRNDGRRWSNDGWRSNDRGDRYRAWNRNDWRRDNRYDWQRYRASNRNVYRVGRYYAPYSSYSYRRLSIGFSLGSMFYGNRYWINDPWSYRLPPVYGPYRWVRYYDDVVLVDIYTGEVMDVIYDFFW